ncbi:MAG: sulfide-dependent adenosine diphosphate thiazole synthase [Candidatus Omnitrophota bacterium]
MFNEAEITRAIIKTATDELLDNLEVDVAIAGAGPAGLTSARYLAKKGKKVVIFERKLNYGGGMPGGGMLFPRIVIQKNAASILEEVNVKMKEYNKQYYTADSVEAITKLGVAAIDAGVRIYPAISVEDLVIREKDRVSGVVINWSAVKIAGLHVDPLVVLSKYVIDATGHDVDLVRILERKNPSVRLKTKTGKVIGEKSMWADKGEKSIALHTKEVFPGLVVSGMAVNAVYGLPRMGAIFGGMLLSGKRAAELILSKTGAKTKKK